jgi:hypothetical protein
MSEAHLPKIPIIEKFYPILAPKIPQVEL